MELNSDGIIRADIMTARIEDKNLLKNAGEIYVGTGITKAFDNEIVYETKAMNIQAAITQDVQKEGLHTLNLGATTCSGTNAISLGYNANVNANGAVQISEGTNAASNSLQFKNRTVVNGSGEITGDYPLGFSKRVTDTTWPKSHVDLTNGTVVTDWVFIDNNCTSEIAFVSIFNQKDERADLNLVIDGNIYVDDGKRKVYAEGDIVSQAEKANYPTGFTKRMTSGWSDEWPKRHADLKDGTVVTDWDYQPNAYNHAEIAFVATDNAAAGTIDLNLVIDGNIYVGEGMKRVYAEGDTVEKATKASKTSFSEKFVTKTPGIITLTEIGTYQFYYPLLGFSCLLYYDGENLCRTPILVSPTEIPDTDGAVGINQDQKFYMQIKDNGEIVWYKENIKLSGGGGFDYSIQISWEKFNPVRGSEGYRIYYRKIN